MPKPRTPKRQGGKELSETDHNWLNDSDSNALKDWMHFETDEKVYGPFFSDVIEKTLKSKYKSAKDVLDDYKLLKELRNKFMKGKDQLLIETYAAEYFRHYAMKKKGEMLRGFSTMLLSGAALQDDHKEWIHEQLEEDNPYNLILNGEHFIRHWNSTLASLLHKDVLSGINKRNTRKLEFLEKINHNQNEFQAHCVAKKILEFKKLKCEISSAHKFLELLSKHSSTYLKTLGSVMGDQLTLNMGRVFSKLLGPDEHDLATLWFEETRMNELVQKKKEREQKARDVCEASWSQVMASSGLLS